MFNEWPLAHMEIVFHTPLSSLMPSWGWCVYLQVCVYVCVCVQVAHMLLEWRWEGRNKEGIEGAGGSGTERMNECPGSRR